MEASVTFPARRSFSSNLSESPMIGGSPVTIVSRTSSSDRMPLPVAEQTHTCAKRVLRTFFLAGLALAITGGVCLGIGSHLLPTAYLIGTIATGSTIALTSFVALGILHHRTLKDPGADKEADLSSIAITENDVDNPTLAEAPEKRLNPFQACLYNQLRFYEILFTEQHSAARTLLMSNYSAYLSGVDDSSIIMNIDINLDAMDNETLIASIKERMGPFIRGGTEQGRRLKDLCHSLQKHSETLTHIKSNIEKMLNQTYSHKDSIKLPIEPSIKMHEQANFLWDLIYAYRAHLTKDITDLETTTYTLTAQGRTDIERIHCCNLALNSVEVLAPKPELNALSKALNPLTKEDIDMMQAGGYPLTAHKIVKTLLPLCQQTPSLNTKLAQMPRGPFPEGHDY
jgi:hypothetical protein